MRLLPRSRRGTWLLAGVAWLAACAAVWYLRPFVPRTIIRLPEAGRIIGFQPDSRTIVTNAWYRDDSRWAKWGYPTCGGPVRLWDAETGRAIAAFLSDADRFCHAHTSRTGRWLALTDAPAPASVTAPLRLFDLTTGRLNTALPDPDMNSFHCFFGHSDAWIVDYAGGRWRRFPVPNLAPTIEIPGGQTDQIMASPDGRTLAVVDPADKRVLQLRDVATEHQIGAIRGPVDWRRWNAAVSDSRALIAGVIHGPLPTDLEIAVWDVATGRELFRTPLPSRLNKCGLALSSDGRTLTAETYPNELDFTWSRLTVWDLPSGSVHFAHDIRTDHSELDGVYPELLSPDGRTVRVRKHPDSFRIVRPIAESLGLERLLPWESPGFDLFDTQTGRSLGFIPSTPWEVNWSPDGTRLVTTDQYDDRLVTVWDIPPRKSLTYFAKWTALLALPIGMLAWLRVRKLRAVVPA